jgi:hypothetical protein
LKKVLFITWDSDQTNYLESLFFPIFSGIQNRSGYKFLIAQFSWAPPAEINRIKKLAEGSQLDYFHFPVSRFPHPLIGSLWTVLKSERQIKNLIEKEKVEILIPRSTMPAWIVNRIQAWIKSNDLRIIFDADGFPLQERIDFAGLSSGSLQYRFLKNQETRLLRQADAVLTRSKRAIEIHLQNHPGLDLSKFFKVSNGRNPDIFKIDEKSRTRLRSELKYSERDVIWVYTGSLGPAYAWEHLLEIFRYFISQEEPVKLLILTRNSPYLNDRIPEDLIPRIQIFDVGYEKIPEYLNAGDLGINLRVPAPSLAGLFPIKLGEYLLTGLPVFTAIQIGDTPEWTEKRKEMIGVDLSRVDFAKDTYLAWKDIGHPNRMEIRDWALQEFSLENSIKDYLAALESLKNQEVVSAVKDSFPIGFIG